jgi:hypothetical protein
MRRQVDTRGPLSKDERETAFLAERAEACRLQALLYSTAADMLEAEVERRSRSERSSRSPELPVPSSPPRV